MPNKKKVDQQAGGRDARRDFWLQQYAAAFSTGDKRGAAVALQFARQCNRVVARAEPKAEQLG
jgi:hypothetical protein